MFAGEGPTLLEVPAGVLDGESDEEAQARREAFEEVGLELADLELIVNAWSMASVSTERVALYLAQYGEQDRVAPGGGIASEDEFIQVVQIRLSELSRLAAAREITDMKTLVLVLALQARRPELFIDEDP